MWLPRRQRRVISPVRMRRSFLLHSRIWDLSKVVHRRVDLALGYLSNKWNDSGSTPMCPVTKIKVTVFRASRRSRVFMQFQTRFESTRLKLRVLSSAWLVEKIFIVLLARGILINSLAPITIAIISFFLEHRGKSAQIYWYINFWFLPNTPASTSDKLCYLRYFKLTQHINHIWNLSRKIFRSQLHAVELL